jgi:hypothetical protein
MQKMDIKLHKLSLNYLHSETSQLPAQSEAPDIWSSGMMVRRVKQKNWRKILP